MTNHSRTGGGHSPVLRLPWLNSATKAARRACSKTPCSNLPTLRPPSREPLWIRGSRFLNQQPRFSKSRLPWTAAAVDPRLQRGDASPRSTASSCAWFRPSLGCRKPAKWRAWRQLRNQMLERPDIGGSVVVSWGVSYTRSLSNQPFPQVTRPVPGVHPAGLRYLALGTRQRTLARHNPVTRLAGTRQDKTGHWCRGPYIKWGPYCIVNRIPPY